MSPCDIAKFVEKADVIQVGARNMQNFDLLKELGKTRQTNFIKKRFISNYGRVINECGIYYGRGQ